MLCYSRYRQFSWDHKIRLEFSVATIYGTVSKQPDELSSDELNNIICVWARGKVQLTKNACRLGEREKPAPLPPRFRPFCLLVILPRERHSFHSGQFPKKCTMAVLTKCAPTLDMETSGSSGRTRTYNPSVNSYSSGRVMCCETL
jgi:hypothetical protein